MQRTLLGFFSLLTIAGCPSIDVDPDESTKGPTVEFDPAHSILPFPNDLARSPDGKKIALPAQACESETSKAIREGLLNTLDGFGTYQAGLQVTLTEAVDMTTVAEHLKMYRRDGNQSIPIGTMAFPSVTIRYPDPTKCDQPAMINSLVIVSTKPLVQNATYDVALLTGMKGASGELLPDGTWLIARSKTPPVVFDTTGTIVVENNTPLDPTDAANVEQLHKIEFLWNAHKPLMAALDAAGLQREELLVAWSFTTATVTDTIDPSVADSAANKLLKNGFAAFQYPPGVTDAGQGEAFLTNALGTETCAAIGCAAVQDVVGFGLGAPQLQTATTNPLAGGQPVPGPFNDPIRPTTPTGESLPNIIRGLAIVPKGEMPANGWPTVIFGHGLGSSKESLAVFGPQLASQGFASVAIDFVAHGDRAVRISDSAALGCAGEGAEAPKATEKPQCFALFLSTDLAGTRDNFRQTVLDLHRLALALKTCTSGMSCTAPLPTGVTFKVDSSKLVYAGISLGGIIGSTFTATNPDVKAAVLNVPGVGLLDILENTETVQIRCSLVNALIDKGILKGDKWTGGATGLCVEADQGWKKQPGYAQFSTIARWVLDPADGANYTTMLANKRFLIQKVVGDQVVPNIATDREAALVGLEQPMAADPGTGTTTPSAAISTNPLTNKFVAYTNLAAAGGFPGNTFEHASLLRPSAGTAGALGTQRVQTDAITFLYANK